jgi:hypothetical protein
MNNRGEGSNTAIVAIVVLVMAGLFAFFLMSGGDGDSPDIKVNIEKPAEAVGDAAKGVGEAAKEAAPGE